MSEQNEESQLADLLPLWPRQISAMMRIKDEQDFLYPAVQSIIGDVDEVLLIDNLSTDRTLEVVESLLKEYPEKVRAYEYPHHVTRVGSEQSRLVENDPQSPNLLANYYNWCLERCTRPYVLKWDGDMIALDRFHQGVSQWRESDLPIMVFYGANVHPDRQHLLSAKVESKDELASRLTTPGMPSWVTSLTYDYPEPRLFPKHGACYESSLKWVEQFDSPFYRSRARRRFAMRLTDASYLHLKFCKPDPCFGYSADLKDVIMGNLGTGPELDQQAQSTLRKWRLAA